MKLHVLLVLFLALALAGCGSSSKKAGTGSSATLPTVLPPAPNAQLWAKRVVDLLLRPLNKDLRVLNGFNSPDVRLYIASQNPTTLRILHTRLNDLQHCSDKLVEIGPPTPKPAALARVYKSFKAACTNYVEVAKTLLKATDFLSSGRTDVIKRGESLARSALPASGRAANNLVAGVKIAQTLPVFRRAGLRISL